MPTYLKLGGSLITDKNIPRSADRLTIERLAHEIAAAWQENPFEPDFAGEDSQSHSS